MDISSQLEWIAVDWGTSSLRAWAIDGTGKVIAEATSDEGMGTLMPDEFEPALLRQIGVWLPVAATRPIPVIACGMVGARQGWCEAVYHTVPCPPLSTPLTAPQVQDARIDVQIIPGLSQAAPPDVMRGEETQIAGLLHDQPDFDGTVCLPGTHSKWVRIENGAVTAFQTFMTGELFALLSTQSILRHTVGREGWSDAAFASGVDAALTHPDQFAGELFPLRAGALVSDLAPAAARARLSGLLIGSELAAARRFWDGQKVTIIGNSKIGHAYATALTAQGTVPIVADAPNITLSGLRAAYQLYQETLSS